MKIIQGIVHGILSDSSIVVLYGCTTIETFRNGKYREILSPTRMLDIVIYSRASRFILDIPLNLPVKKLLHIILKCNIPDVRIQSFPFKYPGYPKSRTTEWQ